MAQDQPQNEARPLLAESRRQAIAERVRAAGAVTVAELEARFGVSSMTARRDLAELERQGVLRRTHGGAVLPSVSAHEDSFAQRVESGAQAKQALAAAAVRLIAAGETVFLDSSSTTYFVARAIIDAGLPVTLLTNSLPVMDLVTAQAGPNVDLVGVGGTLRRLTQSFVGPYAVQTVRAHFADRLFMSVKGITPDGTLTDADLLEAEVKRTMIDQSAEGILLLDGSKFAVRGLHAIAPVGRLQDVIAHGAPPADLAALRASGVTVLTTGDSTR